MVSALDGDLNIALAYEERNQNIRSYVAKGIAIDVPFKLMISQNERELKNAHDNMRDRIKYLTKSIFSSRS